MGPRQKEIRRCFYGGGGLLFLDLHFLTERVFALACFFEIPAHAGAVGSDTGCDYGAQISPQSSLLALMLHDIE